MSRRAGASRGAIRRTGKMADSVDNKAAASGDGNVKKIGEIIKGIDFAMLSTIDEAGDLHSRPMSTQQVDFDGDVFFFAYDNSTKAKEISANPRVNVSYSAPSKQDYVSLTGRAEVLHDRAKMEELWSAPLEAWFPQGLETPNICLIKVDVTRAEFWDSPSSPVAHIIGLVKSKLTGKPANTGDNEKVEMPKD